MSLTDLPGEPEKPSSSPLKKLLPLTSLLFIGAVLYAAWTFYSRYQDSQKAQQQLQEKQQEARKKTVNEVFGNGEIRFETFEVDNGNISRGDTAHLCYGVENATSVKLDPPVEPIKPSYRHCIDIAPKTSTIYTITATDAAGHTKSLSLPVKVH